MKKKLPAWVDGTVTILNPPVLWPFRPTGNKYIYIPFTLLYK